MPSRLPRLDGAGLLVIICALLLGVPSAASATVRYTSPAGTVASGPCTDTAGSCSIVHLFSVAAANDELVLKPGSYGSASARISSQLLTAANGVNVHGTRGNPARIFSSAAANGAIALQGNTTTLSDVAIDNTSGSALFLNAGLAQRVAAIGGGAGCQPGIGATTFADSLCVARTGSGVVGNAGAGPGTTATIVFRNATLVGSGDGLFLNAGAGLTYDATLSNVIASGGPGNFDIEAGNPFGDGATV